MLHRFQCASAGKDREPAEQHLLVRTKEVVAPAERGLERLLSGDRSTVASTQQRHRVAEPRGDLLRRECRRTCRGELEGKRDAVEPVADLEDRVRVGVRQREAGARGGRVSSSRESASPGDMAASVSDCRFQTPGRLQVSSRRLAPTSR